MSKKSAILFRCTEEQKAVYEAKAIEHGLNLSQLVIAALDAFGDEPVAVQPKPIQSPAIKPNRDLEALGVKKGEVEGVDYWFNGSRLVRPNLR